MESKALRELSALYLDSVYDEGYEERNEDYDLVQKQRRQDAEARKHVARKETRKKAVSKVKNVVKGFLGKEETKVREDFINKLIESGKFTDEEIEKIVESRLDKEPPSQFEKGDDDRGNPDYMKTSSLKDEEKWKRLQDMRRKSKKDSVRAKAEETDQLGLYNSLIESGKFSDEEIEKIVEAQAARNDPEKYERDQEKKDTRSKKQKRMDDPHIGINSPAFKKFMKQQGM